MTLSADLSERDVESGLQVREAGKWAVALGTALLLMGTAALLMGIAASTDLHAATIASVYYVGLVLVAGGALQIAHAVTMRLFRRAIAWGLGGLLYMFAGATIFFDPTFAERLLTVLVALWLACAGLLRFAAAGDPLLPGRGWLVASGLVGIVAAALIALDWPMNSTWILGLILTFDLIFYGIALVGFGLQLRAVAGTLLPLLIRRIDA